MGFWKILEKLFKRETVEVKPYVEKDTKCDKCEYLQECIDKGNVVYCSMSYDEREHYIRGIGAFGRCDFDNIISAIKSGVEPPEEIKAVSQEQEVGATLKQKTESVKSRKCIITIYGNSYPAVVEEHSLIIDESDELFNKIVKRKYYLGKPLPFWKEGAFEIAQDNGLILECYMSDDRMRLIQL